MARQLKQTDFNEHVHLVDDKGDPVRDNQGGYKLREDWRERAVDKRGRRFNPKIHESDESGEGVLNRDGFLRMGAPRSTQPMMNEDKLAIDLWKEEGYAYYWVDSDERNRPFFFSRNDYEIVEDPETRKPVTRPDGHGGELILHRKPEEWYAAQQEQKLKRVVDFSNRIPEGVDADNVNPYQPDEPLNRVNGQVEERLA